MKGKKSDPEFISAYIKKCLEEGLLSTKEILELAKSEINDIANKIMEVEELKKYRSKLLDVVSMLDKEIKVQSEDYKMLEFFELQHPDLCKNVCTPLLSSESYSISDILPSNMQRLSDFNFVIKQLVEYKVLVKNSKLISRGERFADYIKYVFHQVI